MSLLKEKSDQIIFQEKKVVVYKLVFINSFFFLNRKKGINFKILMKSSCSVKLNSVSSGKKPKLKKKTIKVRAWPLGKRLTQDPKEKQCLLLTNSHLLEKS